MAHLHEVFERSGQQHAYQPTDEGELEHDRAQPGADGRRIASEDERRRYLAGVGQRSGAGVGQRLRCRVG